MIQNACLINLTVSWCIAKTSSCENLYRVLRSSRSLQDLIVSPVPKLIGSGYQLPAAMLLAVLIAPLCGLKAWGKYFFGMISFQLYAEELPGCATCPKNGYSADLRGIPESS